MHAKHARRRDFTNLRRAVSAAAVAVGLVIGLTSVSTAAPQDPAGRQAIAAPDSVNSTAIIDGSVWQADMADPLTAYLRAVPANGVFWSSLNNGIVSKSKLASDVADELAYGSLSDEPTNVAPVVIANIGGPFATRATLIASVSVDAGTSLVNANAFFARTTAGAAGTRPQLALRYDEDNKSAGTIMGAEISPSANRELTGSSSTVITVAEPTVIRVYAFGYNDNGSDAGSGEITAAAQVSAVKVGLSSNG